MADVINGFLFKKVDSHDTRMMETVYRLRFEVYARQCNFIREEDYPLELESDEYDPHSIHFVAINPEGVVIATVRMILINEKLSPLLKAFPKLPLQYNFSCGSVTEISRMIICKKLRTSNNFTNRLARCDQSPRLSSYATIVHGLCQEIYQETESRGITHWGALMEKGLWGLLRIYGIKMKCVGPDVDFFGPVRPYIGSVADFNKSRSITPVLAVHAQNVALQ